MAVEMKSMRNSSWIQMVTSLRIHKQRLVQQSYLSFNNMNYKNLTISKQILFVAIALSVVLLIFLLSFLANQVLESKNSIKQIVNQNRSFSVIEKIDRNFYERFGDVQAYAYNKLAIEAIDSGKATPSVQKFINTMVYYYVLYDLMMVVDKEGNVVAVNTTDKNNVPVRTEFLMGKNFA